jgi:hypothetical protein
VFAGQNVGVKEVSDKIWLVSFMDYDLGFALPERRVTLHSGDIGNTSGLCGSAKCLGRSVTRWMSGSDS